MREGKSSSWSDRRCIGSLGPSPECLRDGTAEGKNPYREWLETLDVTPRARIQARVLRFSTGNLGDHKSVGGGVWEARVMFGPGYRIYFAKDGAQLVLLLLGGDKSNQATDVARAQEFWKAYQEGKRRGKTK